ncbi:hypothetical protein ABPG72_018989 [Tetrahymena utriculariae]
MNIQRLYRNKNSQSFQHTHPRTLRISNSIRRKTNDRRNKKASIKINTKSQNNKNKCSNYAMNKILQIISLQQQIEKDDKFTTPTRQKQQTGSYLTIIIKIRINNHIEQSRLRKSKWFRRRMSDTWMKKRERKKTEEI